MDKTTTFDPVSELILADFEKPSNLKSINLRTLSPFQRALLVIDGTVTKFIEAYTMEPVATKLVSQSTKVLSAHNSLLDAPKGTSVLVRQVILEGRYSHCLHAYASSLIIPGRLRKDVLEKLNTPDGSIGKIILHSKMEQYRELLWFGKEVPNDLPEPLSYLEDNSFLSRTYRISSGNKAIMLINEKFHYRDENRPTHH